MNDKPNKITALPSSHIMASSKALCTCSSIDHLTQLLDTCLKKLGLYCSYQISLAKDVFVKHFADGDIVSKPDWQALQQSPIGTSKLIALESTSIFKFHFVQLHVEHKGNVEGIAESLQDLLLLWLQQIETWCFMWQRHN